MAKTSRTMDKGFWTIDGVVYDLESFAALHPGGAALLHQTRGQDISTLFYTRHRQPSRLRPLLSRFAVAPGVAEKHSFRDETEFLHELHGRLAEQRWQEAVVVGNISFAAVMMMLAAFGAFVHWRAVKGEVKLLPYAILIAATRLCLAATGRSFRNQKISFLNVTLSRLVEIDYRSSAGFGHETERSTAGHVARLMRLPRGFRLPLDTCLGFLYPLTSCRTLFQCLQRFFKHPSAYTVYQWTGCLLIRAALLAEFCHFAAAQKLGYWTVQFLLTRVLSLALAICAPLDDAAADDDWPCGIIHSTVDVVLTGNPYVDCLLTSGLSCERIHRLLPFQWSPFAHIAVAPVVEEVARKRTIQWQPPVHLITNRLYSSIQTYFLQPSDAMASPVSLWEEHISRQALRSVWTLMWDSIFGEYETMREHVKTE